MDGAQTVRIFNEEIRVRAQIWTINGFSAHADQASLLHWLGQSPRRKVLLVHGDYDVGMRVMGERLDQLGIPSQMPGVHEPILLGDRPGVDRHPGPRQAGSAGTGTPAGYAQPVTGGGRVHRIADPGSPAARRSPAP